MKRFLYPQLAFTNMMKHSKTYIPYLLSSLFTVSMFYILHSISSSNDILLLPGGDDLRMILNFGVIVIMIFACIFIFYTNSFLIKQRKKEIGLYNILGMEKKHIMTMLLFENIYVIIICLVIGLLFGILFSKFLFLILLKLASFSIILNYHISIESIIFTGVVFIPIFLLTLIFNIFQIHISNPITLLHGSNVGEKEPKTKWILTIIGVVCLSIAYYIAQTISDPMTAFTLFFVAVILVIIGTYTLFIAGSIAILKVLKKNKKFYYQTKHFTVISGMIYRMKQNAVGLANICILSTCIIVMLATTISLYFGIQDMIESILPYDIVSTSTNITNDERKQVQTIYHNLVKKYDVMATDFVDYQYALLQAKKIDDTFILEDTNAISGDSILYIMGIDEYNQSESKNISLKENEILMTTPQDKKWNSSQVIMDNHSYTIKDTIQPKNVITDAFNLLDTYIIVVSNSEIVNDLHHKYIDTEGLSYSFIANLNEETKNNHAFISDLQDQLRENELSYNVKSKTIMEEDYMSMYGGFLFIGIFLGIEFLIATALIIYYKQVSEGYDDKNRFEIMQKVGMSNKEIKKSIHFQVLSVFFLPLIVAVIHYGFAFKIITQLLALFQLTNISLFFWCSIITIVAFILFYTIVYLFTSKAYYKIVK